MLANDNSLMSIDNKAKDNFLNVGIENLKQKMYDTRLDTNSVGK